MSNTQTVDTPVPFPTSRVDAVKSLLGDLARPVTILVIAISTGTAILLPSVDATKLGAAGVILITIFGAKSYEAAVTSKANAQVEVAKANQGSTTNGQV